MLEYKKAIIYDKRSFIKYYLSLLLSKHLLLCSFCPNNDYNVRIIKISIFFLALDIFFVVNTLFFSESTIHQIYSDEGVYNFSYFIGPIIYSFIISYIIINLIRYYSLSERILIEIKNEENGNILKQKIISGKKCLIIKYIIFYVMSFLFIILFWLYLASFCAVYQNSQFFVFKNALIDLGISFVYSFLYNLFPALLRIIALRNNMRNEFIFKASNFFGLF
jgi:hypothetical protein